jgi:hypothetical protein
MNKKKNIKEPPKNQLSEDKLLHHRNKRSNESVNEETNLMKKKKKILEIQNDLLSGMEVKENNKKTENRPIFSTEESQELNKNNTEKFHKEKISLNDLLSTLDQDTLKSKEDYEKTKNNIQALKKISKEKEQGLVYQNIDEHTLKIHQRREAFDDLDEKVK